MRSARSGRAGARAHGRAAGRCPGRSPPGPRCGAGRAFPGRRPLPFLLSRGDDPMLEHRGDDPERLARRETAPSRRTSGSGPVRSITVDGVPGSSPPSTSAAAAARSCSGTSSSVRGSGPPGRFALVATSAPTWPSRSCAAPASAGMRTPIVSGREPASQGKRRAGFGMIKVYGPGRSARTIRSSAPRNSGRHSSSSSRSRTTRAVGCCFDATLGEVEPADGGLGVRRGREPVDRVGRDDRQLAVPNRRDRVVDVSHAGLRRRDRGRPGPASSRRRRSRARQGLRPSRAPVRRRSRARGARLDGARRARRSATVSGMRSPTSATCGS